MSDIGSNSAALLDPTFGGSGMEPDQRDKVEYELHKYSLPEEIANAVTHGIGAVFSIVGLTMLVMFAVFAEDMWRIVSVSVFGATMLIMYVASTLYHAFPHPPVKRVMRVADHCAIYLLIAGTYTPFLLVSMRGPVGWTLFAVLWGTAAIGCLIKLGFTGRWNHVSTAAYVVMGWTAIFALKPALEMIPSGALVLLLIGGLAYTGGVVFYVWERIPYNHAIWHCFVLTGTIVHFFAVLLFVARVTDAA